MSSITKLAGLGLLIVGASLNPTWAAPIPVRFAEGVAHGFLLLRSIDGGQVATGDLLQIARDGQVEKRMIFKFPDGSVFEETVVFTERDVYRLENYRLVQRGPQFDDEIDITLSRATGTFLVKTRARADGQEQRLEGAIELPPDLYNGMLLTVVKDLPVGATETVHYLAFTPEPRMIQLELEPAGEQQVFVGELAKTAIHYALKPRLGVWLRTFATLLGRVPPDVHVWFVPDDVPAFVRFEGPLYPTGPVWRIELASPSWPD